MHMPLQLGNIPILGCWMSFTGRDFHIWTTKTNIITTFSQYLINAAIIIINQHLIMSKNCFLWQLYSVAIDIIRYLCMNISAKMSPVNMYGNGMLLILSDRLWSYVDKQLLLNATRNDNNQAIKTKWKKNKNHVQRTSGMDRNKIYAHDADNDDELEQFWTIAIICITKFP